jgi:hypothetical protein
MGRDAKQGSALATRFEHEAQVAHFQVSQTTVDEPGRSAARAACEIALVE